jgi:acyl-ACP thioesterase
MNIYEKEYKIQSSDVDMFRRLRISRLFNFMQEAAIHHTEQLGAGRSKTLDRGFLWVVTMQHAEIRRLPEYDETVKLVSWPGNTMHVMFPRYYTLLGENGDTLVSGSALWMLMDMNTRSMIFPDEEGISIEGTITGSEYPLPRALKPVETDRETDFTVPFSFSDINGHLTNTRYFDLTEDLTSLSSNGKVPVYVAAEYSGEARFGETFRIDIFENESSVFLCGTGSENKKLFKIRYEY